MGKKNRRRSGGTADARREPRARHAGRRQLARDQKVDEPYGDDLKEIEKKTSGAMAFRNACETTKVNPAIIR